MEPHDPTHPVRARRQKGRPEMQRPFLLPEARAWNDADARGVQEPEAVELVWLSLLSLRLLDGFSRDGDGGEEVHGALSAELGIHPYHLSCRYLLGDWLTCGSPHSTPSICLKAS